MYSSLTCHLPNGMLIFVVAIGHNGTNLIGQDSNIIVIRGGNRPGKPTTDSECNRGVLPDSDILDENAEPMDVWRAQLAVAESSVQQPRYSLSMSFQPQLINQ